VSRSRDLLLEFWDPLHIWGTLKARNLTQILIRRSTNEKNAIRSNEVGKGSHDLLFKFWDPLHISGTCKARNFKFGRHIDNEGH